MYIQLSGIQKKYLEGSSAEVHALKDVNLNIHKGESIAIVGASGSGKSTILHLIGFLDKSSEGQYYFEGDNVNQMKQSQLAYLRNKRMGFVLQQFGLIHDQTVFENVSIPLLFSKTPFRKIKQTVEDTLEEIQLESLSKKRVNQLSGGQKQRVAIARALVNDPDIILADEPTGSLDSKSADEVMQLLLKCHALEKTIIVVTHHTNIAEQCERIIKIKDGVIC